MANAAERTFLTLTQLIASTVVFLVLKIFTRLEVHGRENLAQTQGPLLITPNHKSMIDAFAIGALIIYAKTSLAPLHFMTKDRLFLIPGLNLLLWSLGAFRAKKKKGVSRALEMSTEYLRAGEPVIIFPEAHIVPGPALGVPRQGAAILALSTGVPALPVSFWTSRPLTFWNFFFTHPKVIIRIGESFSFGKTNPHMTEGDIEAATRVIMERISNLYSVDLKEEK